MINITTRLKPWGEAWICLWDVEGPAFRAFGTEDGRSIQAARRAAMRRIKKILAKYT